MSVSAPRRWTYADLEAIPDDNVIRAIIDGELFVTPSPENRHQDVSSNINDFLRAYAKATGGKVYYAPAGMYFDDYNFVEPDLMFIKAENRHRLEARRLVGPPDLVVEISSPSTRRIDRGKKRDVYARFGVPEYWFVDLKTALVEVYILRDGAYAEPAVRRPGDLLQPEGLPGLLVPVDEALATD